MEARGTRHHGMTSSIPTVTKFRDAKSDVAESSENPFHSIGSVWSSDHARMKSQSPLNRIDQFRKLGRRIIERNIQFEQDRLRRGLDELLSGPDRLGGVLWERSLDPIELIENRGCVS